MTIQTFNPESVRRREPLPSITPADFHKIDQVDSSKLQRVETEKEVVYRKDFASISLPLPSVLIGKSSFVSDAMVAHLMRDKKESALAVKYVVGDAITNMEGAMHTFVTPVCPIFMTGDFKWVGHLQGSAFGNNRVREVILSAAIQPDFEFDTVVMPLIKAQKNAIVGEVLDRNDIPTARAKENAVTRSAYEEKLLKHMVYHLSPTHQTQALHTIAPEQILDEKQAKGLLEQLIRNPGEGLQGKFMRVKGSVISLEILLQIYVHQLRNEFKVLNAHLPQGYVYTISPPAIFAAAIGGAAILNRLQALAFQFLASENLFSHLKMIGFNDYADPDMVSLLHCALPQVKVISEKKLFDANGAYQGPQGCALVLHNNSDAFGQNIETEGATSLDGVIGSFSNAAEVLKRNRPDLLDFIF